MAGVAPVRGYEEGGEVEDELSFMDYEGSLHKYLGCLEMRLLAKMRPWVISLA